MAASTHSTYTVSKVKTFTGMEGPGFNALLLRDGKAVAKLIDDASGGPVNYEWADGGVAAAIVKTLNYPDQPHEYNGTVEEALFHAYCMSFPKTPGFYDRPMVQSPDSVVSALVDRALCAARLKRLLAKYIVMIKDGKGYKFRIPDPAAKQATRAAVAAQYPGATILNGLTTEEAVTLIMQVGL